MKLTIEVTEDNKVLSQIDEPISIDNLMPVLFTVQLSYLRASISQFEQMPDITPEQLQALKEDLYDKYNAGASNVLSLFIPDKELRPDLTVEAMRFAEDQYMYNQLNRKERRELDKKTKGETKILQFRPRGDQNETQEK